MNKMSNDSQNQIESFFLGEEEALLRLKGFDKKIHERRKTFIGYPCNGDIKLEKFFQWWEHSTLSKSPLNEVGNPESETSYTLNARPLKEKFCNIFPIFSN